MERILTFEIEQTARVREQEMMKNISATVTDLELRDRYLSLSLLDVHNNMTIFDNTLSRLRQQQKTNEQQQNMTIQNLSLSVLDVHNYTAELSSSLSSLDAQQKRMKSEIQTLTISQQNDITKLNDTIIHLKNRVQSNVAFTAGIIGESGGHTYTGTVKFPEVIYQVGGGYNPTTGVFTAPKAGLYLIFCTNVAKYHETFWTKIMMNGSVKAGAMAYVGSSTMNVHQSASNLVVHQLQVGDRVWIEVFSGSHLYSALSDTTFSVIMINGSD
ncbi:complement C1q and tumor necrosis factor-related protein 9A-like [Saccostrea cucullata]|uniref:complement C1q and tumor necrosis factor-related protein 9A-like n=1 Tax=Saccostrea cuccullata TaxID=36930 RepID=UPI002ED57FB2